MAWYRSGESCRPALRAPGRVGDPDPERPGVGDGPDGHRVVAAGVVIAEELEGHDRDARRHADDALPVEGRGDRPGHVRAMPVVVDVVDGVVVVAEVPAVDVVDVAVAVVVDPVGLLAAARLARVRPRPRGQVRMAEVDPVVDDRHDRARRAGRDAQRLATVDVDVGRAAGERRALQDVLAGVVEAPQLAPGGLVGRIGLAVALVVDADLQRRARRPGAWTASSPRSRSGRGRRRRGWRRGRRRSLRPHRRSPRGGSAWRCPGWNVTISRPGSSAAGRSQACRAGRS